MILLCITLTLTILELHLFWRNMRKLVKTIKTLTWLDNFGSTSTIYVSRVGDTKNLEEDNTTIGGDSNKLNEEDTDEINTNIHNKCQNRSEDKSQLYTIKEDARERKMNLEFERIKTVENIYYE